MYSPPFRSLTADEDAEIVEKINAAKPDFVWVGLGAPKQERWMAAHENRVQALMLGVGAALTTRPATSAAPRPGCSAAIWNGCTA
mgnify:CR=1 FL=1